MSKKSARCPDCLVKTEGQDDDVGDGWLVQGGGSKQVAWQRYTREGE